MRNNMQTLKTKAQQRNDLWSAMAEFEANGGEVKRIERGVTGLDVETRKQLRQANFPEGEKVVKAVTPL
jgi:methylmalonyl-CoA mutase N-terminal domain/subunit